MYVLVAHNFVLVAHKLHFGQEIPSPNSGFIVILQKNRILNLANSIEKHYLCIQEMFTLLNTYKQEVSMPIIIV